MSIEPGGASVFRGAVCGLIAGLLAILPAALMGGCASGPSAWEQGFVAEGAAASATKATTLAPEAVSVRSVPMERIDAAMAELDREVSTSDVPRDQWPREKADGAKAKLLRALQVTGDPQGVEVVGVSRFRSTAVLRPGGSGDDGASLKKFASSIGATQALWSTKYLGKADKIVDKPVTTFSSGGGYWGHGRAWRDDCWPDRWGSSTTWVPVRVQADEYLYVVFFLRDAE